MTGWQSDKAWSDRFLTEIKGILGLYLIGEASADEDQQRNTDLIVLRMEAVRIAVRIRRFKYWLDYPDQFTIRSGRPSGTETELAKILSGWGDYMFYGFADEPESHLHAWMLGDLRVFRLWFQRETLRRKAMPGIPKPNGDRSSIFHAFRVGEMPPSFLVAAKGHVPLLRAV